MKGLTLCIAIGLFGILEIARAGTVDVRPPVGVVVPLRGTIEASVVAEDCLAPGASLTVRVGGVDVTSAVVVSSTETTATDADGDGTFEEYARRYTLDLGPYAFTAEGVVLEGSAPTHQGTITATRTSAIETPIEIGTSDTSWVPSIHGDVVTYYVRLQGIELQSKVFRVLLGEEDVTNQVVVEETVVWDATREGVVVDRLYAISIDTSELTWDVGAELTLEAIVTYVQNALLWVKSILSTAVVKRDAADEALEEACVRECLQAFLYAAGVSTSGADTSVDGDAAAAGAALADCLEACGFSGSKSVTMPDGTRVVVGMPSASGGADVVVGVGGDGTGNGAGQDGSAVNTEPGGAAVAVGGEGGSGGGTKGGDAKATSTGGDSVAIGGDGGSSADKGGPGGSATAENKQGGKTAVAKGGTGGDPGGPSEPGGPGGPAKATAGGSTVSHTGGPGGTGTHGTGGTAKMAGGQSTGSDGGAQPNQ